MQLDVLAATRAACARFSERARTADHATPLPHLAPWTVHDVVAHLAGDHRWALGVLTSRVAPTSGLRASARRGASLCQYFDDVTADLLEALEDAAASPDEPLWNFAQGDAGRAGWWPRHQAHEAIVHLWDLESATGEVTPLDPRMAADGVAELFEVYTSRYGRQVLDAPIVLEAEGLRAWRIEPTGEAGRVRIHEATPDGDADLVAPADVLMLALWHRLPADDERLHVRRHVDRVRAFLRGPLTA